MLRVVLPVVLEATDVYADALAAASGACVHVLFADGDSTITCAFLSLVLDSAARKRVAAATTVLKACVSACIQAVGRYDAVLRLRAVTCGGDAASRSVCLRLKRRVHDDEFDAHDARFRTLMRVFGAPKCT